MNWYFFFFFGGHLKVGLLNINPTTSLTFV